MQLTRAKVASPAPPMKRPYPVLRFHHAEGESRFPSLATQNQIVPKSG